MTIYDLRALEARILAEPLPVVVEYLDGAATTITQAERLAYVRLAIRRLEGDVTAAAA